MDDSTRSTLLVRLKDRGDADAWETFGSLYRPMIVAYAVSRGLDAPDAEDVAQQCTQAVLESIEEYAHLHSFRAWLRTIANHKIVDRFRRGKRLVQGTSTFWSMQSAHLHGSGGESPDEAWDRHWMLSHIAYCAERVRASVNESTYEAFAACVLRGMDPGAVAEALNLSTNQVYVAKHRVLERIREMMRELHGEDGVV
jgi:RNA polymerase sigma-70 factor (ECF subfamily)